MTRIFCSNIGGHIIPDNDQRRDKTQDDFLDWLTTRALPLWAGPGADQKNGGFHDALDDDCQPAIPRRRARVQFRQIYVYATAQRLGWYNGESPLNHGLTYVLHHQMRPDGFARAFGAFIGGPADDTAWLYDQAFCLFAFAEAYRVFPERHELSAIANRLRQGLEAWRLPDGGFAEPPAPIIRQSNPHMHLLEATLAWETLENADCWTGLSDEIAELALDKFIDNAGQLREYFGPYWRPAMGLEGRIVEPGHQFEWAWLLFRWSSSRRSDRGMKAATQLYAVGKAGVDRLRGVVLQQMLDDGSVLDATARLWPQTEWIKAASIFEDSSELVAALRGLKIYYSRSPDGLWWDKMRPDGSFVMEPSPASSLYHIVCAASELVQGSRTKERFS